MTLVLSFGNQAGRMSACLDVLTVASRTPGHHVRCPHETHMNALGSPGPTGAAATAGVAPGGWLSADLQGGAGGQARTLCYGGLSRFGPEGWRARQGVGSDRAALPELR